MPIKVAGAHLPVRLASWPAGPPRRAWRTILPSRTSSVVLTTTRPVRVLARLAELDAPFAEDDLAFDGQLIP